MQQNENDIQNKTEHSEQNNSAYKTAQLFVFWLGIRAYQLI